MDFFVCNGRKKRIQNNFFVLFPYDISKENKVFESILSTQYEKVECSKMHLIIEFPLDSFIKYSCNTKAVKKRRTLKCVQHFLLFHSPLFTAVFISFDSKLFSVYISSNKKRFVNYALQTVNYFCMSLSLNLFSLDSLQQFPSVRTMCIS